MLANKKVCNSSNSNQKYQDCNQLEEFMQDGAKFMQKFDSIAEDLFKGQQLEELALEFVEKHCKLMGEFPFAHSKLAQNFSETTISWIEFVKDDFRLLSNVLDQAQQQNSSCSNLPIKSSNEQIHQRLAAIHWRACKASYLRLTYNKSRKRQEQDRQVPVDWARKAIRHAPNDFDVAYWFMIAIGWQLEAMPTSKEKIILSQVFKLSTLLCIKLRADDPLAHHLLGRYYFSVGNLSWFERTIIKTLLMHHSSGQFKIEGSHAEAEQKFRHAHALKHDWPPTGLWMARVLLAQKRSLAEVRQWCEMGLAFECKEPSTEIEREQLLELREKLN